jgi:hypothetical protein
VPTSSPREQLRDYDDDHDHNDKDDEDKDRRAPGRDSTL